LPKKALTQTIPTHIGIILDGNRRWAKARGLPTLEGHRKGYENIKVVLRRALDLGVRYVSVYVFSTENWNRSKAEVDYLMKLLKWVVTDELQELHEENIRILWAGSRQKLKPSLIKLIEHAEDVTKHNTAGTLVLCLNHGGHREIAEAVQRIVHGGIQAADISESTIAGYLDHPDVPPMDLVIRTSGEQRLSNFMLWRAAYSELIFRPEYWPDFSVASLDECLLEYSQRQRRFGG